MKPTKRIEPLLQKNEKGSCETCCCKGNDCQTCKRRNLAFTDCEECKFVLTTGTINSLIMGDPKLVF